MSYWTTLDLAALYETMAAGVTSTGNVGAVPAVVGPPIRTVGPDLRCRDDYDGQTCQTIHGWLVPTSTK